MKTDSRGDWLFTDQWNEWKRFYGDLESKAGVVKKKGGRNGGRSKKQRGRGRNGKK